MEDSRRKTMLRKTLFLSTAATLVALLTSSEAQAWGYHHVGYTHYGAGGVQHYGHNSFSGPYGSHSGSHFGAYGSGGGSYHAGYGSTSRYGGGSSYSGYHSYSAHGSSGGYHAGGYHYGGSY